MKEVILVRHDISTPALFGAAAALVAAERSAQVFWPPVKFDLELHPDAVQHVSEGGELMPSGLIWVDRLAGVQARRLPQNIPEGISVIACHPSFQMDEFYMDCLINLNASVVEVFFSDNIFTDHYGRILGYRDHYGRVALERSSPSAVMQGPSLAIAAPYQRFMETCPAPLAALADAIDLIAPSASVQFIDPQAFDPDVIEGLDGLLLPGGSQMADVEGQISLASTARAAQIPVLGLCLGMQSMLTAMARTLPGWQNCAMAEADPSNEKHSFTLMDSNVYRLGLYNTKYSPGSKISNLMKNLNRIPCNHRYRLSPDLFSDMESLGIHVSAFGCNGVADAIEVDEGFFMGMQGHPELQSRQGSPHPLLAAFVSAAQTHMLHRGT